ncbi:MAG: cyanophycinase [Candidatus Obscuribacterales bacterium]|jgi:cyanophycinase|nr:cyanophycinase [Candidatus Obscuribacterales bacterium]
MLWKKNSNCLLVSGLVIAATNLSPSYAQGDQPTATGRIAATSEHTSSIKLEECKGKLFIVGGAADKVLKRFVEACGGKNAFILVIPHSSASPKESGKDMSKLFSKAGAKVAVLATTSSEDLPKCTGVYMTGGDQNRLLKLLKPHQIEQLKQLFRDGCVIGGSSAGAAAVPIQMIGGGMEDRKPKKGSLMIAKGLGLLPGFMVDTHVNPRGRQDRLMVGMAMVDGIGGIGLDEDTAVEISNYDATVHGVGVVHVYKRAADFSSELAARKEGEMASIKNVIYSIYPAGEKFSLK